MALQLLGNANYHHSTTRRQALLLQLNPKLKQLASDADFKDSALYLFGENFGTLAKERLEAAEALKKLPLTKDTIRVFREATLRKTQAEGVAASSAAMQEAAVDGKPLATKPGKGNKEND